MEKIKELAEQDKQYISDLRKQIHSHAEISLKEFETTKLIADELLKCGIEVKTWEGETGVLGVLKGKYPGKVLALRADIDALPLVEQSGLSFKSQNPGAAHCCGHDIHTSVLIGAARVLSDMKNQLHGTIKFVFQPAEEGLGGAKLMIERKVLENPKPDAIIALHTWPDIPGGTVGYRFGSFMASSDTVDIKFIGRAGHAAHPHKSIDPLVAVSTFVNAVQTIVSRETAPTDPLVITFGKIYGGTKRNIIAGDVTLEGTVRTSNKETQDKMPEIMTRLASNIAAAYRCTAEVSYFKEDPPVVNNDELNELVVTASKEILGEENVIALKTMSMGSEDFSYYMEKVPGCLYRLGTNNDDPKSHLPLHNPGIIFDEKALITGVKAMSAIAFKFLNR